MWIPVMIDTDQGTMIVNLSRVKYCAPKRYCRECPGPKATTIVGDQFSIDTEESIAAFAIRAAVAASGAWDTGDAPEEKPDLVKIRNPWRE